MQDTEKEAFYKWAEEAIAFARSTGYAVGRHEETRAFPLQTKEHAAAFAQRLVAMSRREESHADH